MTQINFCQAVIYQLDKRQHIARRIKNLQSTEFEGPCVLSQQTAQASILLSPLKPGKEVLTLCLASILHCIQALDVGQLVLCQV